MFGRPSSPPKSLLSPDAEQALRRATDEAHRMRHEFVGPQHLLLALLRPDDVPALVLREAGVERQQLIDEIERRFKRGTAAVRADRLPYTSNMRKVFELATTEARARGESLVAPVHLLMAILQIAQRSDVLSGLGIDLERVRTSYDHVLGAAGQHRASGSPGARRIDIRIDDASSLSIYEQLVAQVKEAVATGALRAGERLPTVRQLADQLDIAPGTVARAYGELERLGVVVTGGARGTRVAERESDLGAARRPETLVGLLRPVAVAAFHLGATADEMRGALERAMDGIFGRSDAA